MYDTLNRLKENQTGYSNLQLGQINVCNDVTELLSAQKGFNLIDALEHHATKADRLTESQWYSQFASAGVVVQIETTCLDGWATFVEVVRPRR